jgi:hypothetical protein
MNPHSSLIIINEALVFRLLSIYFHIPVCENLNCCLPEDMQMQMGVLKDDLFYNYRYELNVLQLLKVF